MTRKQVKLLAEKSFVRRKLDSKRVLSFTKLMKRKNLREYVRAIKAIDAKNKVTIVVPSLAKKGDLSSIARLYLDKEVIYEEYPTLMVGVKIIDNDLVHYFNLKNSLENIVENI